MSDWDAADSAEVELGAEIGEGTRIWNGARVRAGARVGRRCNIGQNVYVGRDVEIGDGCKIQNNVSVYEGVVLEANVFCGPSMTFTNLSKPLPRAAISRPEHLQKTIVRRGASIGAGAVIVCGHEIGAFSFVAAGAVVIRDVPEFALVAGNPAQQIGWVCCCGHRLTVGRNGEGMCPNEEVYSGRFVTCGRRYRLIDAELKLVEDPHLGCDGYSPEPSVGERV